MSYSPSAENENGLLWVAAKSTVNSPIGTIPGYQSIVSVWQDAERAYRQWLTRPDYQAIGARWVGPQPRVTRVSFAGTSNAKSTVVWPFRIPSTVAPADREATIEVRGYSREELVAHVEMLGDALNEVAEGAVNLQRGSACKYCPAEGSCPAQLASLSALVAPAGPGPITPERAGFIWLELRQAKKRLEAIEDACKAMAAELPQGLPLPGGKRLVATTRSRTTVDAKALEAVAREHGATNEEIAACARSTTYFVPGA